MQIKDLKIFDSTIAADGAWIDVSNLVALSIQVNNIEGNTWIEVSNDPNVNYDGAAIGPPGSAPTISAVSTTPYYGNLVNQGTLYVKTTFITPWGETTASAESSVVVPDGKVLLVAAPVPTATQAKTVIGWNVYVGKSSGAEVLQTMPQFQAQRVIDTGALHWATAGALPLSANGAPVPYYLTNGYQNTQVAPPVGDNSGGVNTGVKIPTSGTLVGSSSFGETQIVITGVGAGSMAMVNPSSLVWKWLRVRKDSTAQTIETIAYLMGQNG
jgi:hypothetical protein